MGLRSKAKSALTQLGFFVPADSQLKNEDVQNLDTKYEQPLEEEHRTEDYEIESRTLRQKLDEARNELLEALNDRKKLQDEVIQLRNESINIEKQNQQLRHSVDLKSHQLEELQKGNNKANSLCEKLKTDIQQNEQKLEKLAAAADSEVKRLRGLIVSYEAKIVSLNTDIAQLSNRALDTHHDDRYFAEKYERYFEALNQWVLQTYGGNKATVSEDTIDTLHDSVKTQCYRIVGKKWKETFLQRPICIIQSLITTSVEKQLLTPFLFGIKQNEYTALVGDGNMIAPEELINYRISTIKLVSGSMDFSRDLSSKIQNLADGILSSFSPLVPESTQQKNIARLKRLKTILQTITDVTLEAKLEPSNFEFILYQRGTPCDFTVMMNVEEGLNRGGQDPSNVVVRFTISPAIFRHAHDHKAVLPILKAKVLVLERKKTR